MSCLTRKAAPAERAGHGTAGRRRGHRRLVVRREQGRETAQHQRGGQELAVDHPGAEDGSRQERRAGEGRQDGAAPASSRGMPPDPGRRCHGQRHGEDSDQAQGQPTAEGVRGREDADQDGRSIDPVVPVERGARAPLAADEQETALVGAQRRPQEREPGPRHERAESGDARRRRPRNPSARGPGALVARAPIDLDGCQEVARRAHAGRITLPASPARPADNLAASVAAVPSRSPGPGDQTGRRAG